MTSAGLAVFVFVSFLVPVPLLHWLDSAGGEATDGPSSQMYAGHFAAGLALKAKVREAPLWGILLGVGLLDLLFGPFVLLGIERVTLTPGISPGFSLDYIDWSHSLLMSIVWSALFGLLFWRWGRPVATAMGVAAFSHFVLDLPMHPQDLALWPGSAAHVGFGLWRILPTGWWLVELAFVLAAGAYYLRATASRDQPRWQSIAVVLVVLLLHAANSPWLSALQSAAGGGARPNRELLLRE